MEEALLQQLVDAAQAVRYSGEFPDIRRRCLAVWTEVRALIMASLWKGKVQ